jgi:hypothetical protein
MVRFERELISFDNVGRSRKRPSVVESDEFVDGFGSRTPFYADGIDFSEEEIPSGFLGRRLVDQYAHAVKTGRSLQSVREIHVLADSGEITEFVVSNASDDGVARGDSGADLEKRSRLPEDSDDVVIHLAHEILQIQRGLAGERGMAGFR